MVKPTSAELTTDRWEWCRLSYFLAHGVPKNLIYGWVCAGKVRAKKVDLNAANSATFFNRTDVLREIENLPNANYCVRN